MSASTQVTFGPAEGHKHTHTVVFLHGRDSEASEFATELFESEASGPDTVERTLLALLPTVRWVFPPATMLRSERFDTEMSQWFDMWSVEDPEERDELQLPGLRDSVARVRGCLQEEEALVPRSHVFLCGISQGFATALATFFADGQHLGGLVGLSSWMPRAGHATKDAEWLKDPLAVLKRYFGDGKASSSSSLCLPTSTPVLLEHCQDDEVIRMRHGLRMRDVLLGMGMDVTWHAYEEGGHWLNEPRGVDDLVSFFVRCGVPAC